MCSPGRLDFTGTGRRRRPRSGRHRQRPLCDPARPHRWDHDRPRQPGAPAAELAITVEGEALSTSGTDSDSTTDATTDATTDVTTDATHRRNDGRGRAPRTPREVCCDPPRPRPRRASRRHDPRRSAARATRPSLSELRSQPPVPVRLTGAEIEIPAGIAVSVHVTIESSARIEFTNKDAAWRSTARTATSSRPRRPQGPQLRASPAWPPARRAWPSRLEHEEEECIPVRVVAAE